MHWQEDNSLLDLNRLLRAARGEQPAPASLQRALLAAGMVGATSLASTSAAATASNAAVKGLASVVAKWVVVGAVSAGTVATTAVVVKHHQTAAVQAETSAPSSRTQQIVRRNVVTPPVRQEERPAATPKTNGDGSKITKREHRVAESVPARAASASTLAQEMALIDAARASLRAGRAADALQSANEYNRQFSAGRFAPEALYLIMQARRQLGQQQAATDAAREIIQRFPDGPQVGRAREVLQSEGERDIP